MLNAVKLSKHNIICIISSIFIWLVSCEQELVNPEEDNTPLTGKPVRVHVNLLGAEFESHEIINADVRTSYMGLDVEDSLKNVDEKYMINPSTIAQVSVAPDAHSSQKFGMTNIRPGKMFRVIAYKRREGFSYYTHRDYVVGNVIEPLVLEKDVVYDIVAYSYDSNGLPMITPKERENISNEILNYDDNNRNFMAVKIPNYAAKKDINMLNITLKHKVSQFIIKLESYIGDINKIDNAKIYPHHRYGTIDLANDEIKYIEDGTFESIQFYKENNSESSPVFINADTKGGKTGMLSMDVMIDGKFEHLGMPNSFNINPGTKNQINIEFKKCGAYLGPNPNNWHEFMCHNLGANYNSDPFTPSQNLHGAKYQWGNKDPMINQVEDQNPENDRNIIGWKTPKPSLKDAWYDIYKKENDPCPKYYRVPSKEEWDRLATYNIISSRGVWEDVATNYSSGIMIGDKMFLPNEGFRRYKDARIMMRGKKGLYWTSSNTGEYKYAASFEESNIYKVNRIYEEDFLSIRCIKE